jgi:spore coat protein A, manganese oxidase
LQAKEIRNKKKMALITATLLIVLFTAFFSVNASFAIKPGIVPLLLDPKTIPKYVNQLVVPPVFKPDVTSGQYAVSMEADWQQILPPPGAAPGWALPAGVIPADANYRTTVWGYRGNATAKGETLGPYPYDGTFLPNFFWSPSASFEAVKGTETIVNWTNNINVMQPFAVDPTLNWANPANAFPPGDVFAGQFGTAPTFSFANGWYGYDGFNNHPAGTNPNLLNAQTPVALVPHLHGAEVMSYYDGGPEAWWTSATTNLRGPNFHTAGDLISGQAQYKYPNAQEPNTLWYHDHALGITRINVMSGLAGFYLLRDLPTTITPNTDITEANLDEYLTQTFAYGISEIPLAIQDRTFQANGELWFPEVGLNPTIHPYWMPEFFGNTIMVNGKVWPNLDITPGWYRFRILDGSNARFYTLSFDNKMPFTVIGEDGGYLQNPVTVNTITIAPGERADILVDFSLIPVGTKIILTNTAKAPFPNGAKADPQTTGQIMQFTVKQKVATPSPTTPQIATVGVDPADTSKIWTQTTSGLKTLPLNPAMVLNPTIATLAQSPTTKVRYITLNEVMGPAGPVMVLINGQYYDTTRETVVTLPGGGTQTIQGVGATENATAGTTEEWVIINLTADTHPIHLHLVTFQLVSRQPFQATKYNTAWLKLQTYTFQDGSIKQEMPPFDKFYDPTTPGHVLNPLNYYQGKQILPTPLEKTWKDTIQMNPGEVTTIKVRFASQDGTAFPAAWFQPVDSGIYVYHCHIIDHEDNEMMRPMIVR